MTHVTEYTVETHPEYRRLKDKAELLALIKRENSDSRNELNIGGKVMKVLSHVTFSLDKFEAKRKPNVQLMTP